MSLQVGEPCPDFTLPLVQGNQFHLSQVLKRGPVILNFIRGTWCEYCTAHLLRQRQWQILLMGPTRKKVTILVISNESLSTLRNWLDQHPSLSYLMASDASGEVAESFSVRTQTDTYSRPALFVIDRDQVIRLKQVDDLEDPQLEKKTEEALKP